MLVIRFIRIGKKNQPFFRIVVTDKRNPPRGGRFLEILGFFNPLTKERKLKPDRIKYWLNVGAQPSDRVHNLLVVEKVIEGKKIDVHKKPKKREEKAAPPEKKTAPSEKEPALPPTEAPAKEKAGTEAPVPAKAPADKPAGEEEKAEPPPKTRR